MGVFREESIFLSAITHYILSGMAMLQRLPVIWRGVW